MDAVSRSPVIITAQLIEGVRLLAFQLLPPTLNAFKKMGLQGGPNNMHQLSIQDIPAVLVLLKYFVHPSSCPGLLSLLLGLSRRFFFFAFIALLLFEPLSSPL